MTNWLMPGFVILIGFGLIMIKLPLKLNLWLLGHALIIDIVVSVLALVIHWGTFTGVMAAAFAGLLCSAVTMLAVKLVGCIHRGKYERGFFDMSPKLAQEKARG